MHPSQASLDWILDLVVDKQALISFCENKAFFVLDHCYTTLGHTRCQYSLLVDFFKRWIHIKKSENCIFLCVCGEAPSNCALSHPSCPFLSSHNSLVICPSHSHFPFDLIVIHKYLQHESLTRRFTTLQQLLLLFAWLPVPPSTPLRSQRR